MVTLRRDIAEGSKTRIYDYASDSYMTGYDKFIAERNAKKNADAYKENTVDSMYAATMTASNADAYSLYLDAQLHRAEPDPVGIISKEEFYRKQYQEKSPKDVKTSSYSKSGKKLSKRSMVFLSAYVLMVVAVTSIIIAVNSTKGVTNVDAKEDGEVMTIQAMTVEKSEPESTNWFDRLLDSISNK